MSLVWIQIPHSTKFKIYIFFSNVLIEIRNHTNQNPFSLFLLLLLYFQNHLPSLFQNPKTLTLTHTNTHRLSDRLVKQAISLMTAVPAPTPGRELSNPPADGISNLRFSNHSDHLLVSSWDKVLLLSLSLSPPLSLTFRMVPIGQSVRLYDASANALRGEFMHGGPVLDCCFHDDSSGFSAGADNTVRRLVFFILFYFLFCKHFALIFCLVAEKVRETKKKIR